MEFYNYPENKEISPFESIDGDSYFAVGNKLSYLGSFNEIGNISSPFDPRNNILNGSNVLNIFKRYAVIENGKVIYVNEGFDDGHIIGSSRFNQSYYIIYTNELHYYKIDSWGTRMLETYFIQDTKSGFNSALQHMLFETKELATKYALKISSEKNMKCIVAQWFGDIDRR